MDSISSNAPLKQCTGCKQFLPATLEYFQSDPSKQDLLSTRCKVCKNTARKQRLLNPVSPGFKRCTICKQDKPATYEFFHMNNAVPSGLCAACKVCINTRNAKKEKLPDGYRRCGQCKEVKPLTAEYFIPNLKCEGKFYYPCRMCTNQSHRALYHANPERYLQVSREYYWRDPERARQRGKRSRQSRREEIRASARNYQQTHREQRATNQRNRLARKKAVPGTHTEAQIQEQLKRQHYKCYYAACGFAKFPRVKENGRWKHLYHVEHTYPLSRVAGTSIPANDMGYLVLACDKCNESKHNKFPWEWFEGGRLM